jgi:hypothetical protein
LKLLKKLTIYLKLSIIILNKVNKGIVVQWSERRPVTAEVAGSSPVNPDFLRVVNL